MARKKVITRKQILDAAYDIVKSCGFTKLTARHIAEQMHCSTQPIYLEFKNMADLKHDIYLKIEKELEGWLIRKEPYDEDPVVSLCVGYIEFATVETSLYRTLSVDNFGSSSAFKSFIYHQLDQAMLKSHQYDQFDTEEKRKALISVLWMMTTGLASAVTCGLVPHDVEKIIHILNSIIRCMKQGHTSMNIFEV